MIWKTKYVGPLLILLATLLFGSCISYKFTGASIDYTTTHTIQIDNITNRAPYGWAPMEAMFNNRLRDIYANQTRFAASQAQWRFTHCRRNHGLRSI